jgi:hypothetical protein
MKPAKYPDDRSYGDADLARFERYRIERAKVPPKGCTGGVGCWVEEGPPGLTSTGSEAVCRRCRQTPRTLPDRLAPLVPRC